MTLSFELDWGKGPFPRSPRREQLYRAFLEDPRNAENRNVYVDLCAEEGDPHGELVRLGAMLREKETEQIDQWGRVMDWHPDVVALRDAMDGLRGRYGRSFYEPYLRSPLFGRARFVTDTYGYASHSLLSKPITSGADGSDVISILTDIDDAHDRPDLTMFLRLSEHGVRLRRAQLYLRSTADITLFENVVFDTLSSLTLSIATSLLEHRERIAKRVKRLSNLTSLGLNGTDSTFLDALGDLSIRELKIGGLYEDVPFGARAFPRLRALSFVCNGSRPSKLIERTRSLGSLSLSLTQPLDRVAREYLAAGVARSRRLVRLSLRVHPAEVSSFLATPMLSLCELKSSRLGGVPCPALPATFAMPQLRRLAIEGEVRDPESFARLPETTEVKASFRRGDRLSSLRSALISRLVSLYVDDWQLPESDTRAFFKNARRLRDLTCGPAGLTALSQADPLPHLRDVHLVLGANAETCSSDFEGAVHRSGASWRRLSVSGPQDEMLQTLIESRELDELGSLHLWGGRETRLMDDLERRFGHRLRMYGLTRTGPVTLDPCADPWFFE